MRSPGRPRRRAEPPRPAVSRRNSRRPSTSSATVRPAASLSPNTSVAEALIVPGDPSGRPTIKFKTRFSRENPLAHNNCPNNGWVDPVTRTSHGKTERRCAVCRHRFRHRQDVPARSPRPARRRSRAQGRLVHPGRPRRVLRRHRADDTVSKAIARVLRADLVMVDDIGLLPVAQDAPKASTGWSMPHTKTLHRPSQATCTPQRSTS